MLPVIFPACQMCVCVFVYDLCFRCCRDECYLRSVHSTSPLREGVCVRVCVCVCVGGVVWHNACSTRQLPVCVYVSLSFFPLSFSLYQLAEQPGGCQVDFEEIFSGSSVLAAVVLPLSRLDGC